ncbi:MULTISPECIES: Druantia anti-phage system protein DruA [unclassified Candidatus Frackibacter]|uniref:Druantia anti-phage system protein DruA n=1 Tax=unclassified Candidatus Frackibacter TaxID=2648818 RepID=UPI000883E4F2|nr:MULTISPECIES: Druantia anti-phage system protein DruA [unclassified Candidatus Frackibacter]SDC30768.1 protein of unknown function [Candidatus Frackibacter sp. WG11]SFL58620.1 protein of unknown function [Candidatus Frackibacter sp. WG13]
MSSTNTESNLDDTSNRAKEEFISFNPELIDFYNKMLIKIGKNINTVSRKKALKILNKEIEEKKIEDEIADDDLEKVKFIAALCILRDLLELKWDIIMDNETIKLAKPDLNQNKDDLRQQLQRERNIQLKKDSIRKFINKMEKDKEYNGERISIKNIIGDKDILASRIKEIKSKDSDEEQYNLAREAIKPYLQLVDKSRCSYTGYRLRDIWRYFRYTWSLPYKQTPGRNRFYLIRDASQPCHPVIGISALGNVVLNLSKRDNYIGWTLDAIKDMLSGKKNNNEKEVEGDKGKVEKKSKKMLNLFNEFIKKAIDDVYIDDLIEENIIREKDVIKPKEEIVKRLSNLNKELRKNQLDNEKTTGDIDWEVEAKTSLFKKKRVRELARLLEARMLIQRLLDKFSLKLDQLNQDGDKARKVLKELINYKDGKVINIALEANRKQKIGSNIMEIIVCGAIPPYNHLLGGKLVSLLTCSPFIVQDYKEKYSNQVSRIASKMKGEEVVRDSRLAYLGTTSLYGVGSSQYNRLKMPVGDENHLEFKELGKTEGYTSVYFADDTTKYISKAVEIIDGGRRVNNIFGEGTSPRMRLLKIGLTALGIKNDFLKQENKRIIYGIELASNAREFLRGETDELNYFYSLDGNIKEQTQEFIEFWRKRWFLKRIYTVNIIDRLESFDKDLLLVSNSIENE